MKENTCRYIEIITNHSHMCVLPLNFFKVTYFSLDINVPTAQSIILNECKQLLCKIFCWNSPNFTVCFHDCFFSLDMLNALIS